MSSKQDGERFDALFREHGAAVRRYLLRRGAGAQADDLAAETFAVAWRRLANVPDDDPLPWLLRTARNVLSNARRSERRRRDWQEALPAPAPSPDLHDAHANRDDARRVLAAIAQLPEHDREILLLVAWDGLTPAQCAAVVGRPAVTVRSRLMRARRRLADRLAETPTTDPIPVRSTVEFLGS